MTRKPQKISLSVMPVSPKKGDVADADQVAESSSQKSPRASVEDKALVYKRTVWLMNKLELAHSGVGMKVRSSDFFQTLRTNSFITIADLKKTAEMFGLTLIQLKLMDLDLYKIHSATIKERVAFYGFKKPKDRR